MDEGPQWLVAQEGCESSCAAYSPSRWHFQKDQGRLMVDVLVVAHSARAAQAVARSAPAGRAIRFPGARMRFRYAGASFLKRFHA